MWLIAGAGGILDKDLIMILRRAGQLVRPSFHATLDITDSTAVAAAIEDLARSQAVLSPGTAAIVVNTTAWTDVDSSQTDTAAYELTATGAGNIAQACEAFGVRMIHLSSDDVFDGSGTEPYTEDTPVSPRSTNGRTKAASEKAVLQALPHHGVVLRTAWLYGGYGHGAVSAVVRMIKERDSHGQAEHVGQPTWTVDLARRILDVGRTPNAAGIYHATNSGATTRAGLARAVLAGLGLEDHLSTKTGNPGQPPEHRLGQRTQRLSQAPPSRRHCVLSHGRWAELDLPPMRSWREALADAIASTSTVPSVLQV
jgi:dTDP-4-dehydrorhamnose reductase